MKTIYWDRDTSEGSQHAQQPTIPDKHVWLVKLLLEVDRHWAVHQLAVDVRVGDLILCHRISDVTAF